jgi:hypothetical protein
MRTLASRVNNNRFVAALDFLPALVAFLDEHVGDTLHLGPRCKTFVIFAPHRLGRYSVPKRIPIATLAMNSFMEIISSIPLYWWIVSSIGALTIVAVSIRAFETDRSRAKRAERNKKKELRSLAERISSYGHGVHQRYPTGDVIVSERDLAEQLRKRPDAVVTALNLLLNEQKVQRAPLNGYWRLNL